MCSDTEGGLHDVALLDMLNGNNLKGGGPADFEEGGDGKLSEIGVGWDCSGDVEKSDRLRPVGVIIYDIFINCNWVDTRWQQYSTHLHTNSTHNDTKQTICNAYPRRGLIFHQVLHR